MKTKTWLIVLAVLAIALGGLGYYSQHNSTAIDTAGLSTYSDGHYYFSFRYPDTLHLTSDPDSEAWPHAILLGRISGSQAYDLAVETWSSEAKARSIQPDLIKESLGVWVTFKNEHNYPAGSPQDTVVQDIIKSVSFTR